MRSTKFTIWEADLAIYPSDGTDLATGPAIFVAEYVERMTLTRTYEDRRRAFSGRAWQENYNADETHGLELDAAMQVGPLGELKRLDRFARYLAVVVWYDEAKSVWLKRTYYGVTPGTAQATGEAAVYEKETLRAERMTETTGTAWPDLSPDQNFGAVHYVNGTERTLLYLYSGLTKAFTPAGTFDATLGQIAEGSGTLEFTVERVLALEASVSDGAEAMALVAMGASFLPAPQPALEFEINGTRVATLGKDGTLVAPNVTEASSAPGLSTDMELRLPSTGAWVGSLGSGGMTAAAFSELATL